MGSSFGSAASLVASALVLVAAVPACSSSGTPPSGFSHPPSHDGAGPDAGSGDDDGTNPPDPSGDNGGGGLNLQDAGKPGAGDLADAGCATATATATRQPVYMLFVLDGSGSMNQNNKWPSAVQALDTIFDDMQTKADPGLGVGMIVFSDQKDPTCSGFGGFGAACTGPYPSSADVSIAFVDKAQHDTLRARIDGSGPNDGTPTGSAIGATGATGTGGYGELAGFTPSGPLPPGGKKVLVLITDGCPSPGDACATSGNGSDNYAANACVTTAASRLGGGDPIETFVVGVGQLPGDFKNYDPYFLGALAQAGGSAPAGCDPKANAAGAGFCFFAIDPTQSSQSQLAQQFEQAIDAIRGQVASCTIPLKVNADAGTLDPSKVNVQINGTTINQDPQNGWTYDNPSSPKDIVLHGTACNDMKTSPSAKVSIVLGCATQTPPPAK